MPTTEYTTAISSLLVGHTGSTDKIKLGQETLDQLLAITNDWTYIDSLGSNTKISGMSGPGKGSVIVQKVPNVSLTTKTALGGKSPSAATLKPVTISWGSPREAKTGLTAYDEKRGLSETLTKYLAKFTEEGRFTREVEGFTALAAEDTKTTANTLSATVLGDSIKFKKAIIKEAVALTQTINDDDGIKFIDRQNIVIHVSEEDAYKLTSIVGNIAEQSFKNGIYTFGTIEGFKFFINPFLPQLDTKPKVILSTNFAFVSYHSIITAGIDPLPGSADKVAFYEDAIAQGLIYDNLVKALY